MSRLIFHDDPRFTEEVSLWGLGNREVMPPGHVSRPRGLPAFLLILFHDAVEVELRGARRALPGKTLVFWDRNRPHVFGNATRKWSHSWVMFNGVGWRRDAKRMSLSFERPFMAGADGQIEGYFANLLREFERFARPDLRIIAGNINLLLQEISRTDQAEAWSGASPDPVEAASRWVRDHLAETLPVAAIATAAGLSPSRLQQLFRERLGTSVQQHVERQRMQEARYWLMHSGLRIGDIALRVGYPDAFYFSRRFRRAFGKSPQQHRATH